MATPLNKFIFVKKAEAKIGKVEYSQAIDDFIYRGQVVERGDVLVNGVDLMGKVVIFRKDAGEEITLDGQKLKAIKSEDIICYE